MNELKSITKLVKIILDQDERARNSDSYLYLRVLSVFAESKGINLEEVKVPYFLLNLKDLGLPAFESVRRTRQKVQEQHPELQSSARVQALRAEKEAEFRQYARAAVE